MSDIEKIVETLTNASDQYYNEGESFLTDAEFDALRLQLEEIDPSHPFLIGVGSEVRLDHKIKLPSKKGSLDQVYENDTARWIKAEGLSDEDMVITDKEDGNSIQIIFGDGGDLQMVCTRGDGIYGQDVTRHYKRMKSAILKVSRKMIVNAEVIMSDDDFKRLGLDKKFKNPRNYVAGQMNSSMSDSDFYDNVHIVAYEVV